MGKSDIVASLKLNSSDYEKKLAQAKASTKKFSKDGGAGLSDMVGKFKTLAGAVAASKAVMETFNAVIKSSQTIGDAYARTMSVVKNTTEQFVYSLANADFTAFYGGLEGIKQRAKDAYDAMDQLGNTKISYDYFAKRERTNVAEGLVVARDASLSTEARKQGLADAEAAVARLRTYTQTFGDNATDYIRKEIARRSNLDVGQADADALVRALMVDVMGNAADLRAEIVRKYEEYQSRYASEVSKYGNKFVTSNVGRSSGVTQNPYYDAEKASAAAAALNAEYAETKQLYTLLNVLTDEQLTALKNEYATVEDVFYTLAGIEKQVMRVRNQLNTPIEKNSVGDVLVSGIGGAATVSPLTERIEGFAPVAVFAEGSYEAYVAAREGALEYADALAVLEAQEMGAADGLMAIGDVVGSIGGLLGEGGAAWADYVGGIISAVSSALPALEALAAAQAAAAVTKTALSPWTAIGAVAAVASVAAAMANIPKFATGGVVPGNALSGDNVLIRANSGEVVLTKQQASNIGSLLGRGGEVTFKIKGDTLVGILNNHNKIASRSYGR